MGRTQWEEQVVYENKVYVNVRKDENWFSKFMISGEAYKWINWLPRYIHTEKKEITPKTWKNVGKQITLKNLVLWIEEEDGTMLELQLDLYWQLSRGILNSLWWDDELWEVFLSVYNNKKWYACMSIRKNNSAEEWLYTPKYTFDEEMAMVGTKIVQWEEKKDYDVVTDKYIAELLPIIQEKIEVLKGKWEDSEDSTEWDLPF